MADKNPKEKTTEEKKLLHIAVLKRMVTLITSAFGLVAALAWNSVIQEFVNEYVKKYVNFGGATFSLFIYAMIVTSLAVIITYQLTQITERLEE